jgi:hypothetical protein
MQPGTEPTEKRDGIANGHADELVVLCVICRTGISKVRDVVLSGSGVAHIRCLTKENGQATGHTA